MIKPARKMGGFVPGVPTNENAMVIPDLDGHRVPASVIKAYQPVAAKSFYAAPVKKASKIIIGEKSSKDREGWGGAVFNPDEKDAVVMKRPSEEEAKKR